MPLAFWVQQVRHLENGFAFIENGFAFIILIIKGYKMKKNIATKWVKALRSGKYKQGYLKLHDNKTGGYCCLGVLCKMYEKDYEGMSDIIDTEKDLPYQLMKDFNIATAVGTPGGKVALGKGKYVCLANANDNHESFGAIANWIESNYALL